MPLRLHTISDSHCYHTCIMARLPFLFHLIVRATAVLYCYRHFPGINAANAYQVTREMTPSSLARISKLILSTPGRALYFTGGHLLYVSNQNPRCAPKPIYTPILHTILGPDYCCVPPSIVQTPSDVSMEGYRRGRFRCVCLPPPLF